MSVGSGFESEDELWRLRPRCSSSIDATIEATSERQVFCPSVNRTNATVWLLVISAFITTHAEGECTTQGSLDVKYAEVVSDGPAGMNIIEVDSQHQYFDCCGNPQNTFTVPVCFIGPSVPEESQCHEFHQTGPLNPPQIASTCLWPHPTDVHAVLYSDGLKVYVKPLPIESAPITSPRRTPSTVSSAPMGIGAHPPSGVGTRSGPGTSAGHTAPQPPIAPAPRLSGKQERLFTGVGVATGIVQGLMQRRRARQMQTPGVRTPDETTAPDDGLPEGYGGTTGPSEGRPELQELDVTQLNSGRSRPGVDEMETEKKGRNPLSVDELTLGDGQRKQGKGVGRVDSGDGSGDDQMGSTKDLGRLESAMRGMSVVERVITDTDPLDLTLGSRSRPTGLDLSPDSLDRLADSLGHIKSASVLLAYVSDTGNPNRQQDLVAEGFGVMSKFLPEGSAVSTLAEEYAPTVIGTFNGAFSVMQDEIDGRNPDFNAPLRPMVPFLTGFVPGLNFIVDTNNKDLMKWLVEDPRSGS